MPDVAMSTPASGDHGAPFRRRRLRPEAEEAERRREENGVTDVERTENDNRRQDVAKHVPEDNRDLPGAGEPCGEDELALTQRQNLSARQTGVPGPIDRRESQDRVRQARAQGGRDRGGQIGRAHV